jgi:imidazole glycerol-phosphate synthase subunit HisH
MQKIVVIKYNAGNIYSVVHALRRLGIEPIVTADETVIRNADKVIFPGVGEATTTMRFLKERKMDELIKSLTQPVLGICLGMQLMCKTSEEGNADCLGIFDVPVKRFVPTQHTQKIPHMGWNQLYDVKTNLFTEQANKQFVYFVHSFYVPMCEHTIATTDYIQPFSAALNKNNFYATQFHPEKSGDVGEQILKNFLAL